ncbi:MAG: CPBP family intramembrane metalloprotease [Actinomycetota bacterium]|nr:CPBP family intramembrane metalloprotease [Actinomycetota bacterium]
MTRFATRVFDRFFTPRMPEPYAGPTSRALLCVLFAVVMLVFPGVEIISAIDGLVRVIAGDSFDPLGDYSALSIAVVLFFSGVPIAMVWVVMRLTGDRMIRLGLLARPAGETAAATSWTFVWIFALGGVLEFGLGWLLSLVPGAMRYTAQVELGDGVSFGQLAAVGIPAAISAGFAEEIVVLGFAYRMLERAGLSDRAILVILVALRMSYHVYYGVGALILLPWAFLSVVYYRRYRRLWPLIIGHTLWDIFAILTATSTAAQLFGLLFAGLLVVAGAVVAIIRWRRVRRRPLLTLAIPRPRPQWRPPHRPTRISRPHIPVGF